jgi:phosphoglycolate phosphatase
VLIVFDLDGTLIDSARDIADATNAVIEEFGGQPLPLTEIVAMVGDGAAVLVRRALAAAQLDAVPEDALRRFLVQYDQRLTNHTRPYEGMAAVLAMLRAAGHSLAVLTNKPQHATIKILERLDLAAAFSDVVGGDTAAGRKPNPMGLQQIMARANVTAEATVLVGDSPVDLRTTRRAGTRVCLARYGFGFRFGPDAFSGDEVFVDSPAEIPAAVARLQRPG